MVATYVQMARCAELAQYLHRTRARALQRRLEQASEPSEVSRLRRQLEAQENQGMILHNAVEQLHSRAPDLAAFAEQGLTMQDFNAMGLENVVKEEDVRARAERAAEPGAGEGGTERE